MNSNRKSEIKYRVMNRINRSRSYISAFYFANYISVGFDLLDCKHANFKKAFLVFNAF